MNDAHRGAAPEDAVRDGTNLMAFLHILKKAHGELVNHDVAHHRFLAVHTREHARVYIEEVMARLLPERELRRAKREAERK